MPRKLTPKNTLDQLDDEVDYTEAALEGDPDAADLAPLILSWRELVDAQRRIERDARRLSLKVTATRVTSNQRVDLAVNSSSKALLSACNQDRLSPRFKRYFPIPPSDVVREPLADEINRVKGWLGEPMDVAMEPFRPDLDRWSSAAAGALADAQKVTTAQTDAQAKREALTADLTARRDALHRELADRAQQRGLGREWPSGFFLVS